MASELNEKKKKRQSKRLESISLSERAKNRERQIQQTMTKYTKGQLVIQMEKKDEQLKMLQHQLNYYLNELRTREEELEEANSELENANDLEYASQEISEAFKDDLDSLISSVHDITTNSIHLGEPWDSDAIHETIDIAKDLSKKYNFEYFKPPPSLDHMLK